MKNSKLDICLVTIGVVAPLIVYLFDPFKIESFGIMLIGVILTWISTFIFYAYRENKTYKLRIIKRVDELEKTEKIIIQKSSVFYHWKDAQECESIEEANRKIHIFRKKIPRINEQVLLTEESN